MRLTRFKERSEELSGEYGHCPTDIALDIGFVEFEGRPSGTPTAAGQACDAPQSRLCLKNPCNAPSEVRTRSGGIHSSRSEEGACGDTN